jgi:TrmH family RNA methyltransferase
VPKNERISKAYIAELAKLKQKKYRLGKELMVVEGQRLIDQLEAFGIEPLELFICSPELEKKQNIRTWVCSADEMKRFCESEHPAGIAGLYPLPNPGVKSFKRALYLDRVSDPGNLGTIFRTAAALGMDAIFLSEDSCELANPKVVRASLGAVYAIPWEILDYEALLALEAKKVVLDMDADTALEDHRPSLDPEIYILGSEAHGVNKVLMARADSSLKIRMHGSMESLNLAISTAILCYHLSLYTD